MAKMDGMAKLKVRLAFREEGSFWNAYLAKAESMEGAHLIGSIKMGAVQRHLAIREAFMTLMKQVLAEAIEEVTGDAPKYWHTTPAPESERSGNA